MQVVHSKPQTSFSQTNGTIIKTGGGKRIIQVEPDSDEDEIEETETIIKKTIRKKKKKKYLVSFQTFNPGVCRAPVSRSWSAYV